MIFLMKKSSTSNPKRNQFPSHHYVTDVQRGRFSVVVEWKQLRADWQPFRHSICSSREDPLSAVGPDTTSVPVYLLDSVSEGTPSSLWAHYGRLIAEISDSSPSTPPLKGSPRPFLTASGSGNVFRRKRKMFFPLPLSPTLSPVKK